MYWEQSGVFLIEFLHSKFHSNLPVYIIKESKNALFLVICLSVIVLTIFSMQAETLKP